MPILEGKIRHLPTFPTAATNNLDSNSTLSLSLFPPHRNVIHASDTNVSAENEINLWFKPEELVTWSRLSDLWIYKDYLQRMDNN